MGQYYIFVDIDTMQGLHNEYTGVKLMEITPNGWSYFMRLVCSLMSPNGPWYRHRVVLAGDYYNETDNHEMDYYNDSTRVTFPRVVALETHEHHYYFINHIKKCYVSLTFEGDDQLHPLPLLLALGNGRGGGDYYGPQMDLIGSWAGDLVSVEKTIPNGYQPLDVSFREIIN